ncbi:uncharacterized protein METZ01_LOCUS356240, partial [marine metagenome]
MISQSESVIAVLKAARRVWAVSAVHGEVDRLRAIHNQLEQHFTPGDRLVYLGNYLGYGPRIIETVDELLLLRRAMLARFNLFDGD